LEHKSDKSGFTIVDGNNSLSVRTGLKTTFNSSSFGAQQYSNDPDTAIDIDAGGNSEGFKLHSAVLNITGKIGDYIETQSEWDGSNLDKMSMSYKFSDKHKITIGKFNQNVTFDGRQDVLDRPFMYSTFNNANNVNELTGLRLSGHTDDTLYSLNTYTLDRLDQTPGLNIAGNIVKNFSRDSKSVYHMGISGKAENYSVRPKSTDDGGLGTYANISSFTSAGNGYKKLFVARLEGETLNESLFTNSSIKAVNIEIGYQYQITFLGTGLGQAQGTSLVPRVGEIFTATAVPITSSAFVQPTGQFNKLVVGRHYIIASLGTNTNAQWNTIGAKGDARTGDVFAALTTGPTTGLVRSADGPQYYSTYAKKTVQTKQSGGNLETLYIKGPLAIQGDYGQHKISGKNTANSSSNSISFDTTTTSLSGRYAITGQNYADYYSDGLLNTVVSDKRYIEFQARVDAYKVKNGKIENSTSPFKLTQFLGINNQITGTSTRVNQNTTGLTSGATTYAVGAVVAHPGKNTSFSASVIRTEYDTPLNPHSVGLNPNPLNHETQYVLSGKYNYGG
jgi:hypothetical protein